MDLTHYFKPCLSGLQQRGLGTEEDGVRCQTYTV